MLYPIQNAVRNRLDLSGIWDFQPDPDNVGVAESWHDQLPGPRPIAVPGSWNEQYEDLFDYFDLGWYVKRTYVPQGWQGSRVHIRVGSACYAGTVYINGHCAGSHEGGHLPFDFDITDLLVWGTDNTIAICVENRLQPTRVPSGNMTDATSVAGMMKGYPATTFDFYPFAGLHRPVILYSIPEMHIEDITVITEIDGTGGKVKIRAQLNGEQASGRIILRGAGATIEAEIEFVEGLAEATLDVPEARLWSDRDPYLYDLTVTTDADCYTLKIGIRTIAVSEGKILLNGIPVIMNGFGRHEDFHASGKGLNLPLMIKDYQLMRWTGANSYRTSHYPYSEEEMMLADREGFLIIDEIPAVSLQFDTPENMAERLRMCLQQIDELIARDKNHPSVVMWSVANEPMPPNVMAQFTGADADGTAEQESRDFLHHMVEHARAKDPSRLVTLVGVMGGPLEWLSTCDVLCINRYWGWYVYGGQLERALTVLDQELEGLWDALKKPIIVTEFGADTQPGLHGHPAVMWTEEYQAALVRGYLKTAAGKPYIAGMQVWNFADFAAVQSPMRVGGMNMKGVFTRTRQPKMAAHALREAWTAKTDATATALTSGDSSTSSPSPDVEPEKPGNGVQAQLEQLAHLISSKESKLTTTLQFDFNDEGVFRLVIDAGAAHIEPGRGDATATMQIAWSDALKLFTGQLNAMVAIMTGKIKTQGDARAFLALQELL